MIDPLQKRAEELRDAIYRIPVQNHVLMDNAIFVALRNERTLMEEELRTRFRLRMWRFEFSMRRT